MASGKDFVENDILDSFDVNDIKNSFAGASAPTDPAEGCRWFDTSINTMKIYRSAAWQTTGEYLWARFPPGAILTWLGGYFGSGGLTGYTPVLGSANTVAGANSYLNPLGWWVCDGTVPNETASDIWDAPGEYLPNLTDDRFIMGDTVAGGTGGSSTRAHTHDVDFDSKTSGPNIAWDRPEAGAGRTVGEHTHTHDFDIANFTTGAESEDENRPLFLAMFYIVRVL